MYNHIRKWRQRWGKLCKLKDLSGAIWDDETKSILLEYEHYLSHIKAHTKDAKYLNRPIEFYIHIETTFSSTMTTGRYALDSAELLGVFSGFGDSEGTKPCGDTAGQEKPKPNEGSKAITEVNTCGMKRKRSCFSKEESLLMSNMTDIVNNVAVALKETVPSYVDIDLYDVVMVHLISVMWLSRWPILICWTTRHMVGGT